LCTAVSGKRESSSRLADVCGREPFNDERMPSEQHHEWVIQARAALIVAAMRRTVLTYDELGAALGMEGVALRNHLRHVLDDVSEVCTKRGEASLAALVVNQQTGQPGAGWANGNVEWHVEVRKVFNDWPPK